MTMDDYMKEEEYFNKNLSPEEVARAIEAEKKGKKVIDRFRKAQSTDPHRTNEIVENVAFFEGKQYKLESYKGGRPHAVKMRTPHATTAIETRVASLIADDYTGTLLPFRAEDKVAVDSLNKLVKDTMLRDKISEKINKCIYTSATTRSAYLHIIWDEDIKGKYPAKDGREGAIKSYVIDKPQAVYIDPEALKLADARWVVITSRTNMEEVSHLYPDFERIIKTGKSSFTPSDRGEDYITNKDYSVNQEGVLTKFYHYHFSYKDGKKHVVRDTVIEKYLVESVDLEGISRIPIAQMRWKNETSSPYGLALMDDLLSLQKAINTIESAITSVAVAYATPSYVLHEASGINPKDFTRLVGVPGAVFVSKMPVSDTFATIKIPTLDESIIATKREFIQEIDRISGITSPFLGQVGTAGNTAEGSRITMERARIVEANVLANVKEFVTDITDIIIDYIKSQYSSKKLTIRDVNVKEGKVEWTDIELDEKIEDIEYDFYINLEVKTPYNRDRNREDLMQIWQMEQQYGVSREERLIKPIDLIEAMELKDVEVYRERHKEQEAWNEQTKSQAILQATNLANEYQLDQALLQEAIKDLMRGGEEMPNFDALMEAAKEKQFTKDEQTNQGLGEVASTLASEGEDPTPALEALADYNSPTTGE